MKAGTRPHKKLLKHVKHPAGFSMRSLLTLTGDFQTQWEHQHGNLDGCSLVF